MFIIAEGLPSTDSVGDSASRLFTGFDDTTLPSDAHAGEPLEAIADEHER